MGDGEPRHFLEEGAFGPSLEDAYGRVRVWSWEKAQREADLTKDRRVMSPASWCPSMPVGRTPSEGFGIRATVPPQMAQVSSLLLAPTVRVVAHPAFTLK